MLYKLLREEGFVNSIEDFSLLTHAQIALYLKKLNEISDLEKLNAKMNKELKKIK